MMAVFAERNIISQRVKSGIKNAKGKKVGRPKTSKDNISEKFWKYYAQYQSGQINISELSRLLKRSRSTIYKYIKIIYSLQWPSAMYNIIN